MGLITNLSHRTEGVNTISEIHIQPRDWLVLCVQRYWKIKEEPGTFLLFILQGAGRSLMTSIWLFHTEPSLQGILSKSQIWVQALKCWEIAIQCNNTGDGHRLIQAW